MVVLNDAILVLVKYFRWLWLATGRNCCQLLVNGSRLLCYSIWYKYNYRRGSFQNGNLMTTILQSKYTFLIKIFIYINFSELWKVKNDLFLIWVTLFEISKFQSCQTNNLECIHLKTCNLEILRNFTLYTILWYLHQIKIEMELPLLLQYSIN